MGRPALGRLLCTEYTQYIHLHTLIGYEPGLIALSTLTSISETVPPYFSAATPSLTASNVKHRAPPERHLMTLRKHANASANP
jgi:hypothetical protein